MSISLSVSAGALACHEVLTQVAAHNIANCSTRGFAPQRALLAEQNPGVAVQTVHKVNLGDQGGQTASGTDLAREMVHLISTEKAYSANALVISTADEMAGCILNLAG